jgi:hypothetical protein
MDWIVAWWSSVAGSITAWWSSLGPSANGGIIGGLAGGSFAVIAQIVSNLMQRGAAKRAEKRAVGATLKALTAELLVIEQNFLKPLVKTLQDLQNLRDTKGGFFQNVRPLQLTPSDQTYFTVFDSNASMLGRINNDQLLQDIVRVYGNAKGLFDYLNANPRLYERWLGIPEKSVEKQRAREDLVHRVISS